MVEFVGSTQYKKFHFTSLEDYKKAIKDSERDLLKKIDKYCEIKPANIAKYPHLANTKVPPHQIIRTMNLEF